MSFPRYPIYKNSDVEWLGQVPAHWNVISIKWLSPVKRGASPRPIDDPKYFDGDGEFAWVRIADVSACDGILAGTTQQLSTLGSSLSVKVAPGELFVSIAGTVGKPCISAIKACIHDGFVYFPTLEIDPKFLYRIFEGGTCYGGLGKWGTQLNLNTDSIGSIRVALPPSDELKQVLAFLDRETAKIDGLVAEQRQLMALLKEKRQAVISHAVTRGLNPDAPTKPSGIEWLGDVPEHWQVVPLKYLCLLLKDGTHLPPERVDEGVPLLSVRNLIDGEFNLRSDDSMISEDSYQALCRAFVPKEEDVLLAIVGATLGKTAVVPDGLGPFHIQRSVAIFRTRQKVLRARFLNLVFQCGPFQALLWEMVGYSAQPGIYLGTLENIRIPVPPVDEQTRMLESTSVKINELINLTAEAQRAIDLLQERRTALISAAVTGQIDVRTVND